MSKTAPVIPAFALPAFDSERTGLHFARLIARGRSWPEGQLTVAAGLALGLAYFRRSLRLLGTPDEGVCTVGMPDFPVLAGATIAARSSARATRE